MTCTFTANNVVHQGNKLSLDLTFNDTTSHSSGQNAGWRILPSPEYLINCHVLFQAKVVRQLQNLMLYVKFTKKIANNKCIYTVKYHQRSPSFSDPKKALREITFIVDNESPRLIDVYRVEQQCSFRITMDLSSSMLYNPCPSIYEDTELTDLELSGEDGSVSMHKAVAAACSPVMKTGLTGEWGKMAEPVVNAPPGTSRETLQHLKDYMYLGKLPSTGVKELMLLASYYMMPDLEWQCIQQILTNISSEDAYGWFEFGMKHQLSQLLFEIMRRVEAGMFSVEDIQKHQKWT